MYIGAIKTRFNSKDGAIDRRGSNFTPDPISCFNSKDGAIDRVRGMVWYSGVRCFNSKDGAIDSNCLKD